MTQPRTSFVKFIILLLISCYSSFLFGIPLLSINQNVWNENTRLVIANCHQQNFAHSQVVSLKPITQDKTFVFLDVIAVDENNTKTIYAMTSEENQTKTTLYQIDFDSSTPKILFQLPFGAAKAKLKYHSEKEQNYLLVLANESESSLTLHNLKHPRSYANIFKINQKHNLEPLYSKTSAGIEEDFTELNHLIPIILPSKNAAILLTGVKETRDSKKGVLKFFFLDNENPITYSIDENHTIEQCLAIGHDPQNTAEFLYLWDSGGNLWQLNLANLPGSLQKIMSHLPLPLNENSIKFVKNIKKPGITCYFLAKGGLFRLDLPFQEKPHLTSLLTHHASAALFVRFGQLILVPDTIEENIAFPIFELTSCSENYKLISIDTISSIQCNGKEISTFDKKYHSYQSYILWDKKHQKETIVNLNEACELSIVQIPITQNKNGRMAWKMN